MGSITLGLGINMTNKFKFDVISRPKYSRRVLFAEQPGKGGIFERYGGHIPHAPMFKGLRKGEHQKKRRYIEDGYLDILVIGYIHLILTGTNLNLFL